MKKLAAENCRQAFEVGNSHSLAQSHLLVVPQPSIQNIESTKDEKGMKCFYIHRKPASFIR